MKCNEAREQLSLLLYGELSFQEEEDLESHLEQCGECKAELERERVFQRSFDAAEMPLPPGMAAQCRRELMATVSGLHRSQSFWQRLVDRSGLRWRFVSPALQPIGALALLLLGYFGSRISPWPSGGGFTGAGVTGPVASRIRYVEPESSGQVRIVVEDAHQRVVTGRADDDEILKLLMAGVQDANDPGLRVESVDLLANQAGSAKVRPTLLYVVQHDPNAGVRLKALEALKTFADDPETRQVLTQVLLTDENPGVRTQVIDLLVQQKYDTMVGLLQELMRKEDNGYVRLRCQRVLHDLNASEGTF